MSKITRRSYKRKKIVMGIALFGAIGLVSTGFAAWVLSASASNDQTPNIKVGTVDNKSMGFEDVKIYGLDKNPSHGSALNTEIETSNYSFNPRYDDASGRVRFGGNGGTDEGERLSLTIRGKVTQAQNLGSLKVSFDEIPQALEDAVDAGYIVLPDCASAEQDVTYELSGDVEKVATFSYEIAFEWGDAFDSENPGDYYEIGHAGADEDIADVEATLEAMHTLLDTVQFKVTFVAMPN